MLCGFRRLTSGKAFVMACEERRQESWGPARLASLGADLRKGARRCGQRGQAAPSGAAYRVDPRGKTKCGMLLLCALAGWRVVVARDFADRARARHA